MPKSVQRKDFGPSSSRPYQTKQISVIQDKNDSSSISRHVNFISQQKSNEPSSNLNRIKSNIIKWNRKLPEVTKNSSHHPSTCGENSGRKVNKTIKWSQKMSEATKHVSPMLRPTTFSSNKSPDTGFSFVTSTFDTNRRNESVSVDEPTPMEIDEVQIVNEIRRDFPMSGKLQTILGRKLPDFGPKESFDKNRIYVIIDTCVFLGEKNLAVIKILFDTNFQGYGYPYMIIPWIVIQELDYLKKNKEVEMKHNVVKAIDFIYSLLVSKHPRMLGQSSKMAQEADFLSQIESNDDHILNCCLQSQQTCPSDLIVLLTNDKNLCSKAIINDIQSYSSANIIPKLTENFSNQFIPNLTQNLSNTQVVPEPVFQSVPPVSNRFQQSVVSAPNAIDDIVSEMKRETCLILSSIIECESKSAYGNLWLKVLPVKPPWDIQGCLTVILKLWIAVFTFLFKREDSEKFKNLQLFFSQGYNNNCKMVSSMLSDILSALKNIRSSSESKEYHVQLKSSIEKLSSLLNQCNQHLAPSQPQMPPLKSVSDCMETDIAADWSSQPANQHRHSFSSLSGDGMDAQNELFGSSQNRYDDNESITCVERGLRVVWNKISKSCGIILDGLHIPNSWQYTKPEVLPSTDDIFRFLPKIYPLIQNLRKCLKKIVDGNVTEENCQEFHKSLINFFLDLDEESPLELDLIHPSMTITYCHNNITRSNLGLSLEKLNRCRAVVHRSIIQISDKLILSNNGF